jgi:hypothetical protein
VIFCGAMAGAGLGFLWFNTYPAMVFMGDVGALALGAALGVIAVIVRHEIVFFIMGGVFVMETASVMLQVASFKLTGKRIFRMAPIHHHFELKGWPEPRVIVRFWIISVVLVLFGLATLKCADVRILRQQPGHSPRNPARPLSPWRGCSLRSIALASPRRRHGGLQLHRHRRQASIAEPVLLPVHAISMFLGLGLGSARLVC